MPVLDATSHDDPEDLTVLRYALGPARVGPLHAREMREAARGRRSACGEARRGRDGDAPEDDAGIGDDFAPTHADVIVTSGSD